MIHIETVRYLVWIILENKRDKIGTVVCRPSSNGGSMIISSSNPQMKQIAAMIKKAKARNEMDAYIVEGIRMVREVPEDMCVKIYASESFLKQHPEMLNKAECVSDKVFKDISDTKTPQGIMAIVKQHHYTIKDMLKRHKNPLFLVLESIQDPGNLGTMIRMAEGAGASGIIMNTSTVDVYNPKVVRSTMGSVFRVPFVYVEDLLGTAQNLKKEGVHLYAAHLKGKHFYFEEDYKSASAILIGNEAAGLSDELSDMADTYIKIPMDGKVESLNAAMAATILMYEAKRQRMS